MKDLDVKIRNDSQVSVTKLVRPMHGGSQALHVECDDGLHYILKFNNGPQGPNVLANEFIGSWLAHALGLPVARAAVLQVTERFLSAHPFIFLKTQTYKYRPNPGLHFGSAFVGDVAGECRPLQFLGPSHVSRISNIRDFLGMYLFDVWAMHQDDRQAVFTSDRSKKTFFATFVDNGHLCGGPRWKFEERRFVACHRQKRIYSGIWTATAVHAWTKALQETMPVALPSVCSQVPSQWYEGNLTILCNSLLARLPQLPSLFEANSLEDKSSAINISKDSLRRASMSLGKILP